MTTPKRSSTTIHSQPPGMVSCRRRLRLGLGCSRGDGMERPRVSVPSQCRRLAGTVLAGAGETPALRGIKYENSRRLTTCPSGRFSHDVHVSNPLVHAQAAAAAGPRLPPLYTRRLPFV